VLRGEGGSVRKNDAKNVAVVGPKGKYNCKVQSKSKKPKRTPKPKKAEIAVVRIGVHGETATGRG